MNVLVACEESQRVTIEFRKLGHEAYSCDLLDCYGNHPEWHKVSLATLANIDFDMLDEKLKLYISAYRELKQTISYLRKCKNIQTYDRCYINYIEKQNDMLAKGKFTDAMLQYIRAKLSMQNVESGVWPSECEDATGFHKSRRYNKGRF